MPTECTIHVTYQIGACVSCFPLQALRGFVECAAEGQTFELPGRSDVAYGGKGHYVFFRERIGSIKFDNRTFDNDPLPGIPKKGFYKLLDSSEEDSKLENPAATSDQVCT